MNRILEISALSINCKDNQVLQNVNLGLDKGEVLGIVGESGSGKSTLLKAIMGILPNGWQILSGEIIFQGLNLLKLDNSKLRKIRGAQLGMIFQDSSAALCPLRTIGVQLEESMYAHGWRDQQEIYEAAIKMFETLHLDEPERIWRSYPFELSGGMNQRVGIGMAAMFKPSLLLADEPTSALDIITQAAIMQELGILRSISGAAIIFVTHNISLVAKFADKIAVMRKGHVVEYGSAQRVMLEPQSEYTRQLIDAVPRLTRS